MFTYTCTQMNTLRQNICQVKIQLYKNGKAEYEPLISKQNTRFLILHFK